MNNLREHMAIAKAAQESERAFREQVAAALEELRAKLQPGLFWTEGTHRTAMAELDATIAKLGLNTEERDDTRTTTIYTR